MVVGKWDWRFWVGKRVFIAIIACNEGLELINDEKALWGREKSAWADLSQDWWDSWWVTVAFGEAIDSGADGKEVAVFDRAEDRVPEEVSIAFTDIIPKSGYQLEWKSGIEYERVRSEDNKSKSGDRIFLKHDR